MKNEFSILSELSGAAIITAVAAALAASICSARAGTEMGGGGTKLPTWPEILADRSLRPEFPQLTFALPDRGTLYASINLLCRESRDGMDVVRVKRPYVPCEKLSDHGDACLRHGPEVFIERPMRYFDGRRVLTIPSEFQVPIRQNGHSEGSGAWLFSKDYELEPCSR